MNKQYRLTSITETGATIQSGWTCNGLKMKEVFEDFKQRYPIWIHIFETRF